MSNDPNFLENKVGGRIIRIKIQPRRYFFTQNTYFFSIKHESQEKMSCNIEASPQIIGQKDKDVSIIFSYSVVWEVIFIRFFYKVTENGCQMVIALGLYFGFHASHQHSMVFYNEQFGYCFVSFRNGRYF